TPTATATPCLVDATPCTPTPSPTNAASATSTPHLVTSTPSATQTAVATSTTAASSPTPVNTVVGIPTQRPLGGAGAGITAPNTGSGSAAGGGDHGLLAALFGIAAAGALGATLIAGAAVARRR